MNNRSPKVATPDTVFIDLPRRESAIVLTFPVNMARLFLVALLALVGCANAFTSPSAGVSRSAVTRATPVEMIGKKSAAKPKKAAKKDDGFWANVCSAMHFVSLDAIARFARSRTRPVHTTRAVDARTAARTPVESWHLSNQNLHEIHSRQRWTCLLFVVH